MKNKLLAGKIIVGGSQGLATATLFVKEGATVIITGRNRTSLEVDGGLSSINAKVKPYSESIKNDI